jgi:hypothetical protein
MDVAAAAASAHEVLLFKREPIFAISGYDYILQRV